MKHFSTFHVLLVCLIVGSLWIEACQPAIEVPEPYEGELYIDHFIAIGDGYTAGVSNTIYGIENSGLYEKSQETSFPALIANQFNLIRTVPFSQRVVFGEGTGNQALTGVRPTICENASPDLSLKEITGNLPIITPAASLVHNLGVPNLKVGDLSNDTAMLNNPFIQWVSPLENPNYIEAIRHAEPAFFTLWMGMNDILKYGLTGGADSTALPTDYITFGENFRYLLTETLESNPTKIKGLIGNIPDITNFPYFAAIGDLYFNPEDCSKAARPIYIELEEGEVPVLATSEDFVLLPAMPHIGKKASGEPWLLGIDKQRPIPHHWVLDRYEVQVLRHYIDLYNEQIDAAIALASQDHPEPRVVKVNFYSFFHRLSYQMTQDGLAVSNDYLSGGMFSLDGIYLTPRGNAMVANEFIKAINNFPQFSAQIPPINITDYPGIIYP